MIKKINLTLFLLLLLTSCAQIPGQVPTGTPVPSTTPTLLPPTLTPIPATSTSTAPDCKDGAVVVQDVTYPDNTRLTAGEKFAKTWKLQNTGTCIWSGYTIAFVSGDKMEASASVPVPETQPQATVDVSVNLVAPLDDGAYTGNFELRDAKGKSVPVGTEPTFWVKIMVGETADPLGVTQRIGNCAYSENPDYLQQMLDIFNKARADAGFKPLTLNDKLNTAAQAHSLDMACNGAKFLEHKGSDGSWTGERLTKVGYTNSYYFELLGIGLPQDALHEWSRHDNQWPAVIDPYVTEIGVGYAYSKLSRYGGYWTVIVGGPH